MNLLEQFEDNANLNPTNRHSVEKFVSAATKVRDNFLAQFGERFSDPAKHDPNQPKEKTW